MKSIGELSHRADSGRWEIPGYRIEGVIGRGGFGEILKATRLRDGRASAVKIAHARLERARTQFDRERRALIALGPAIGPELLSSGELPDGTPWLALEYLRSPSLAGLLPRNGTLDQAQLRAVLLALADVLAELHAREWIHLDLKPGHVFIERTGARLVDFGLAIHDRGGATSTASFGTAAYMSPEQIRGDIVDARADVYAAGAILFELITGATPLVGSPGALRQAHLALRPPRPSERAQVPPRLEEVVLRCLSKIADERYRDCRALRAALRDAFDEPADAGAPPPRAPSPVAALARRTLGLLLVHTEVDLLTLQRAVEACGGAIACADGRLVHVAFEPAARENAVRLALDGAQALMAAGIATRALVDLVSLRVIDGRSGPRYLLTASEKIELPAASELPRLLLTSRAAATIPSPCAVPCPAADGLLELAPAGGAVAARPPLVGRDGMVEELLQAAKDALERRAPTLAAVTGEAGIGKTSVGGELAARLRSLDPPPDVLELRAREGVLGQDETLRALISWALRLERHGSAPGDGGRELLSAVSPGDASPSAWAPLALALGWIPADAPALRPWQAAPGALRAAVVRGAGEALRARARTRPVCIVLDDAHLADAAALDALEYATLAESGAPLFVCALARPPIHAARPGLGERAARQLSLTLGPLAAADGAQLCRRLLLPAENVPTRAVQRLVERSRGVPILLVELVRGLRARGLVRQRGSDGRWFVATDELDALPDLPLVDWLAQREMAGLPEALAAHARLVAILGDEVSRREVAGVVAELDRDGLAATALDPDVATRRLLEIHVLVERDGRIAFRHPLLREAVARSAGDAERRAVHRAAFRYYLLATFLADRDRLPRLATHAEACGLHAEAASLWLQTAESLRARHAYLEAESQYTRALGQLTEDDARGRFSVFRGRGGVRYRLGRYEDAIADLTTAEAHARALGHTAGELDCLLEEATALDWMNDYARSAERVAQAERIAAHRPTVPLDRARLVLARGRAHFRAARTEEAVAAFEAAAALAEALGDPGYETLVVALSILSAVLPNLGRTAEAERTIARAIELAGEHGDALHLASAFNNRRNLWIARGRLDRALADQLSFLQIGRDLGMIGIEYVAQYNLGELLYQAAELERAEAHVLRAVEVESKYPEISGRPVARLLHARLLAYRGDLAGARARCAEIQAIDAAPRGASDAGTLLAQSDQILLEMVSLAAGGGSPADWARLCARSRETSLEQEPIEVHEACGIAALRAGRAGEAEAALRAALSLADRIPNVMRPRLESRLAALAAERSS